MPETTASKLIAGLSKAIEDGDAERARRRLGELHGVLPRLPAHALPAVHERIVNVLAEAQRLKANLQSALNDRNRQRRSVDAYRRMAGQS